MDHASGMLQAGREFLVVLGVAAIGLLLATAVTLAPTLASRAPSMIVIEVQAPAR